jgi:hypothetical protein
MHCVLTFRSSAGAGPESDSPLEGSAAAAAAATAAAATGRLIAAGRSKALLGH